ncbi:hypothetical protein RJT34_04603 [Clitoria ternatea]|uniref:BZIP domain-containing protein n=1 Tax=Clitoria ternatea TaxID=43366 RepID=A0AAN9KLL0_CLITE
MNFRNYGDNPTWDAMSGNGNGKPLVRESSIYSLTFDEFQNTMGGVGKDFGSMNMDELLKNIWTAEETQAMTLSACGGGGGGGGGGGQGQGHNGNPSGLQRQSSLTLPRTLSQKTVDEVWRDLVKDGSSGTGNGSSSLPQRQPTLGEITLEEFLVRAGVVRDDVPQHSGKPSNNNGWFGDFSRSSNSNSTGSGLFLGFQQSNGNNGNLGERVVEGNNLVPKQLPPLSLNSNHSQRQAQQHQHQQPPPIFPKPANVAFATPLHLLNNAQLTSPGRRGGLIGAHEHSMNGTLVQNSAVPSVGRVGLAPANVGSPSSKTSSDVITRSSVDNSSLSPVNYVINRGRKSSAVEKVVERRQRRMIKNRESAARSRARKQAYTFELEAEIRRLKELNQELQKKQAEIVELQKHKDLDSSCRQRMSKVQCLRRTLTGPW